MNDNKLIAEFMGVVFHDDENQYYNADGLHIGNTLQYHSSWDWLMPVVHKIREDDVDFDVLEIGLPIDEVYQAVVEFIKTYNDEESNPRVN